MKRLAVAALALAACAPPSYQARNGVLVPSPAMVYEGATGPLSYVPPTPKDVAPVIVGEAQGRSCQYGLSLPVPVPNGLTSIGAAWGNGGYEKAMADAQAKAPSGHLFDVRADVHTTSVLLVFQRKCVEVHASVAR